jgi:hypothetical protein
MALLFGACAIPAGRFRGGRALTMCQRVNFRLKNPSPRRDGELVTCAILPVRVVASSGPSGFFGGSVRNDASTEEHACHSFETDMWCPRGEDLWVGYSPRL